MGNVIGKVHSIESFALADGPGARCAVFLKGCRMRCQYCHNPDTWSMEGGKDWTVEDLVKKVLRFRPYWKNGGGITVSGGEALLQMEFVTEFFRALKKEDVHTALDTSGNPFQTDPAYLDQFGQLMEVTDLFILDIKEMDEEKHKKLTGQSNQNILDLARYLSDHGKHMWIRHVLVPGVTDGEKELHDLRDFIDSLATVDRVEILPYHTMGVFKWENLGIPYQLEGIDPPTAEQVKHAEAILGIGSSIVIEDKNPDTRPLHQC